MFSMNSGVRRAAACAAFALALVLAGAPGAARAQVVTGSLDGTVVDQSGGVLPGVTVTIANSRAGVTRTVVTGAAGAFRAPLLPVGIYEVTAELSGFAMRKLSGIELTVGQTLTLRIEMAVAGVAETVTVSSESPVIETSRAQVSATVNELSVAKLPVNGRNFLEFALLTPGVTRDVRTGDLSFAGQRGTLNSLIVDGADNNNTFFGQTTGRTGTGRAPYQFSADSVKEFQVNSNSYAAELGRAGGAVINVVTKSGTNDLSGAIFEFYRDKSLNNTDAINILNRRPKSPFHFNQFGGNVGGPLRRDKDFFFFNYDGQRNTQPNPVFLNLPANTPSDPDTRQGIEKLQALAQSWERAQDQDQFLIKTDHQLNQNHRLTLRYNQQDFTGEGFENGGPQNSFEHTGASLVNTRTFNALAASIIRPTLFNEARIQFAKDDEPGEANSANPEAAIRQGGVTVLTIGRNFFSPRFTNIERWQFADSLTWVRGDHKVKGGFDVIRDDIENFFPGNFSGSYTFQSLASFNRGTPNGPGERYIQAFPGEGTTGPATRPDIREYSFFGQDEWRVRPDTTLSVGVRYDLQKFAKPSVRNPDPQLAAAGIDTSRLNTDTNNWQPRVGIAWSPVGRPLVVRAGYGLFYGRTPSIMVGTAHSNNGINVQTITFTGALVPAYPNTLAAIPSGVTLPRPTIFVFDKDYENARVQQASAGFEYEVMPNTSIGVSYLFVKGDDLPRSTDINIGAPSPVTFTVAGTGERIPHSQFAPGPFTSFGRIISFQSTAESTYHGLTVTLNRRFANHFQATAAYTLGRVEDTVPDATAVVPQSGDDAKFASNPADFETDRTDGNNDQRHRFVASWVWDTNGIAEGMAGAGKALVGGWTFGGIFSAQSGQPYSAFTNSVDINRDGNNRNDIAPGTTRNQFRLPTTVSLDPSVTREIPIQGRARLLLIFAAFNVLNRDNFNGVRGTLFSVLGTTLTRLPDRDQAPLTGFGAYSSTTGPRILQLAVKVIF